jgi:hypothetical protein
VLAYLNTPCRAKVYTICGLEFGEYQGCIAMNQLALYGLKSSGFAWRSHLAETLRKIEFQMCYANNDCLDASSSKGRWCTVYYEPMRHYEPLSHYEPLRYFYPCCPYEPMSHYEQMGHFLPNKPKSHL